MHNIFTARPGGVQLLVSVSEQFDVRIWIPSHEQLLQESQTQPDGVQFECVKKVYRFG